jgi:hypothetical protein
LFVVTGDMAEAEDVVQEAFARAAGRWASLHAYDVPEARVRRVALNLAANGLRRRRSRLAALVRLGPPRPVPAVSEETAALAQALRAVLRPGIGGSRLWGRCCEKGARYRMARLSASACCSVTRLDPVTRI